MRRDILPSRLRTGLLAGFLALTVGGLSAAPASAQSPSPASPPSRLGVLTAAAGTLTPSGDSYVLTLRRVAPRSTWFVDRPYHAAGSDPTAALVHAFFATDDGPPNAALEVGTRSGRGATVVVELSHPVVRDGGRTLRFRARLLDDVPGGLAWSRSRRTTRPPRSFGAATLFLDSFSQSCTVEVAYPTTSTLQGQVAFSDAFGESPYLDGAAGMIVMQQSGSTFYGCGATATMTFADATVPGGTYTAQVTWSNPMIGHNSMGCSITVGAVNCQYPDTPGGSTPNFTYSLDNAPMPQP
ncbi:MAG: hypothetical protein JWP17_3214 [Solirubrobacterales bacterium]|jgi:hypothetical protein|nr:hypothetical protein [Solirubrobacterales bacterium]